MILQVLDKVQRVRAAHDAHQEFQREPQHAHTSSGSDGFASYFPPRAHAGSIPHAVNLRHVAVNVESLRGLQAEGGDGHQDEEERGEGHHLWAGRESGGSYVRNRER